MKKFVPRLIHEDDGQDLIEYVLIAAAVSVFLIPIVPNLGNALSTIYGQRDRRGKRARRWRRRRPVGFYEPAGSPFAEGIRMTGLVGRLLSDDHGQDLIEYALLTAAVGLAGRPPGHSSRPR